MEINIQELSKLKPMQTNLFKGDKIYSFNKGVDLITICKLSDVNFETPFAIDNKSLDLIKKLNKPNLEYSDNQLIIKDGKNKFKVKTFSAEIPSLDTKNLTKCNVNLSILKKARKFTSSKETRPVLTSVCLKDNGNIYATDSFTMYAFESQNNVEEKTSINIPNVFIDMLESKSDNDEIEIMFNSNCLLAIRDNITYISRLISGDFPNLSRILLSYKPNYIKFDFKEFVDKINFSKNIGCDKDNEGYIVCRFQNERLTCYGANIYETEFDKIDYSNEYDVSIVIDFIDRLLSIIDKNKTNELTIKINESFTNIEYKNENETIILTPIRKTYGD